MRFCVVTTFRQKWTKVKPFTLDVNFFNSVEGRTLWHVKGSTQLTIMSLVSLFELCCAALPGSRFCHKMGSEIKYSVSVTKSVEGNTAWHSWLWNGEHFFFVSAFNKPWRIYHDSSCFCLPPKTRSIKKGFKSKQNKNEVILLNLLIKIQR